MNTKDVFVDIINFLIDELNSMPTVNLVLAGGGIKGAYQVGAIKYLLDKNVKFNLIVGTSVGAVNGALIAQGDFKKLSELYMSLKRREDLIRPWVFSGIGFIDWLLTPISYAIGFFKGSLYTNKPYRSLLDKHLLPNKIRSSKIQFVSCSYNLSSKAKYFAHSKRLEKASDIRTFVEASSSFTLGMPPVKHKGKTYTDGGVVEPIPAKYGIKASKHKTIIILTGPKNPTGAPPDTDYLSGMALSSIDAMFDEIYRNDLQSGLDNYWKSSDKIRVVPMETGFFNDSFDVDSKKINQAIDHGYAMAKKHLKGFL